MLERVAIRLGPLRERVVFVGGATVELLITDPIASAARLTKDVDAIVAVASTIDYQIKIGDELRALGFREDTRKGAPLCRWLIEDLIVDLMPTNTAILGFSNDWYDEALATANERILPGGTSIRVVTAPCLIATKLEAFDGRGRGDYQASHDLEDLISVVDGRPELIAELATATPPLRAFIASRVTALLSEPAFVEALPGHLRPDATSQARVHLILDRLRALVKAP